MAEIVLFHHVQGLTPGVMAFAETLRQAGHIVHVPDLLEGQQFDSIDEGVAHVREIGFETIVARGRAAVADLNQALVYIGMSLGVLPAQALAQTRPGARGAVLLHGCVRVEEFSPTWPDSVPVEIHGMDADPSFVGEGDIDAAIALVSQAMDGELYLYPGNGHLFTDASLPDYDASAAASLTARVLAFVEPL
jgi:dienelactone hydrolase